MAKATGKPHIDRNLLAEFLKNPQQMIEQTQAQLEQLGKKTVRWEDYEELE